MKTTEQKLYINGLKGISCLLIMGGHFLGIYRYAQEFSPRFDSLDLFGKSSFSFVLAEGYWLYLFFVISGYLIAQSKIKSLKDVFQKSVKRFFRFAFPIFFAYVVIYLIYLIIGFYAAQTKILFLCEWYQKYYVAKYTLKDVFSGPFKVLIRGNCTLNTPYWVLKDMLKSSILIYIMKYMLSKSKKQFRSVSFVAIVVLIYIFAQKTPIISACLIGMLIALIEESDRSDEQYLAITIMVLAMLIYILPKQIVSTVFFASLVLFVPKVDIVDKFLSSSICQFMSRISWGIYSFHWPLICSVGALLMIKLCPQIGLKKSYVLSCTVVALLTVIISMIYEASLGKVSTYIERNLNKVLNKIL